MCNTVFSLPIGLVRTTRYSAVQPESRLDRSDFDITLYRLFDVTLEELIGMTKDIKMNIEY